MHKRSTFGRRELFEVGAATAAAVAIGSSAEASATETPVPDPEGTVDFVTPARIERLTVPDPIPGTKSITLGFGEFGSFSFSVASTAVHISGGRYYSPQSRLILPITLPVGSVVSRVDVFGSTTKPTSWVVTRTGPVGGNETAVDAPASFELVLSITPADQSPLAPGQVLSLIGIGANDALNFGHAAIVHYTEPSDSLVILPQSIRIYDSRPGQEPSTGPKGALGENAARRLLATAAVPAGARAALVNLTVVETSPSGFLALFRGDQAWPGNSTINWDHAQQVIANTTVVPLDALGRFWARARTSTHFLVDVIGYYP